MDLDDAKRVNMEEMLFIRTCFRQSPMVQMCRQMIANQLLNNGVKFCQGGCNSKGVTFHKKDEDNIEDRWCPFAADVIDSVMCYGFVVVHMGNEYPSVLRLETYWLKVGIKDNELEFFVYEKGAAEKVMPSAVVFHNFGFDITPEGSINSLVSRVLPRLQFLKKMRQSAMYMEIQRSEPKYFSEVKDSGNNQNAREGVEFDYYADANAAETSDDMKFQRNKTAISMLSAQRDLYEGYLNASHAAKASAALENVTQLPMGHSVKNSQTSTGRGDLVNIHKIMQEEICATFGVPRSMMFSDSSAKTSTDTVGTHMTFQNTLLWWKKKLSVVLSETYNSLNSEKIVEKIDIKREHDIDELKRKYKVNVYFPVTPFVTNDELRKLYEQGVISWKSYGEYALRNISLPIDDLQPKAPEVDELLFKKPEEQHESPNDGKEKKEDKKAKKEDAKKKDDEKKTSDKKRAADGEEPSKKKAKKEE